MYLPLPLHLYPPKMIYWENKSPTFSCVHESTIHVAYQWWWEFLTTGTGSTTVSYYLGRALLSPAAGLLSWISDADNMWHITHQSPASSCQYAGCRLFRVSHETDPCHDVSVAFKIFYDDSSYWVTKYKQPTTRPIQARDNIYLKIEKGLINSAIKYKDDGCNECNGNAMQITRWEKLTLTIIIVRWIF